MDRQSQHSPRSRHEMRNHPDSISDDPSRRDFLQQVAAGGALLAGAGCIESAAAPAVGATDESRPGMAAETLPVTLEVNGQRHELKLDPRVTLLDALREKLGLSGTKKGCDHGECGACTVLVDGRRINSCLTLAVMNTGRKITTIEGLSSGDKLHPLQAAFIERDGFQCGYCTPGQLCSAVGLLSENVASTPDEIREWMSGNLCRCGAYANIVAAISDCLGDHRS